MPETIWHLINTKKMSEKLQELKKAYLFDPETGMIRKGLNSMNDYALILNAEDEDHLDEIIKEIVEREADAESEEQNDEEK